MAEPGDEPRERAGDLVVADDPWRRLASGSALLAALLLAALVVLVYNSNRDRDEALASERHSVEVMLLTTGLDGAITSSEAALGRFVISGDKRVGTLYYHEWLRAGGMLQRLRRLVSDNPKQTALLHEIDQLYVVRGAELADPAARANHRQGYPALSMFNEAAQSPTGPRIRQLLKQLSRNEQALLKSRSSEAQASTARSNTLAALMSASGILLVLVTAALGLAAVQAGVDRRRARLAARRESERADTLEVRVEDRTRELAESNRRLLQEAAERASAEEQLRQSQKMEAIGQLTGGIAHDFNNMLAVVVSGIELAKRRRGNGPDVDRHLDNALEGAKRAAALTGRLLAFARAEPLMPEAVDPVQLLAGMSELLDRALGERITVDMQVHPTRGILWVDRSQLENAILNLAVNGRDAMDGEGRLTVTLGDATVAAGDVSGVAAGTYLRIAICDEGIGMSPAVRARVFEPFFTTKPVGKGTGLGLSQIFAFVKQSAGGVAIDSVEGEGTTVSLYLPHCPADRLPCEPAPQEHASAGEADTIGGRVLLVEDDSRVRAATTAGLVELGYDPVPAEGGAEALRLLDEHDDFTLVVSDMVMPGMTGLELAREIASRRPGLGVLFVTGFVGEAASEPELANYEVLRKPFTIAALDRSLRDALVRAANAPRPKRTAGAAT